MIFGKTDPKQCAANGTATLSGHALWGEVVRLAWLAAALYLLLALVSYSPHDPSWSTWTSRIQFQNWMGRAGSVLADLLFQLFGLAAFAVAALLTVSAVKVSSDHHTGRLGKIVPILFLIATSALLQSTLPATWHPWGVANVGGIAGKLFGGAMVYLSGKMGSILLSTLFFLTSIILLFRWPILTWTMNFIRQAGPFVTEHVKKGIAVTREQVDALLKKPIKAPEIPMGAAPAKEKKEKKAKEADAPSTPDKVSEKVLAAPKETPKLAKDAEKKVDDALISTKPSDGGEELFRMVATKPKTGETKDVTPPPAPKKQSQLIDFQLPPLSLLSGKAESKTKPMDKNWYLEKANILVQKLNDFGVEGEVVHISPGPVITVYEFKPASGVKIKEIANLSDDLTLALSVMSVRIVAPIPGKPVVGIEIPSPNRETVYFKDLVEETPFYNGDIRIPIVLGRLASGEPVVAGLASMPHLLVAGSTGTGKSVFINTLITSLLYRYTPQQLKLILVDPKMVELSTYEGIPHLLLPVVVDSKKAAMALRWAVEEMERRYSLMHKTGVRHVDAYNAKLSEMQTQEGAEEVHTFLPYLVVIVDEYADLMAVVPKDVELSIARLAQKARASGIHLVLATQRPSTDVVTGTIKANFPSRVSFRVASSIDSKTILDRTGADRLLGAGDMLFHSAGFTSLKRLQGAFLSDAELNKVVDFLKAQGAPEYDERILAAQELPEGGELPSLDGSDADEGRLYDAAVRLVTEKGEASISLIQRHLKIGYNRAATLMEQMEKEGVVAQQTGASKRRQVLVNQL